MSRPEPLVPAECSMAGNDWFPFYFDRVRKSKWWRRASDVARSRNVMMWGEAFKAAPAGSLPDDDDELAEAAGYGMDVDAFLAAKAEIMAPWTLCSDGRWYHPTVCEVVLDAWERTSERRKAAAERQRRRREKVRDTTPPRDPVTPQDGRVTQHEVAVTRDIEESGRDFDIQDRTVQTVQTEPPLPPEGDGGLFGDEPEEREPTDEVRVAFDLWNDTAKRCALPIAEVLSDGRRKAIRKRLEVSGLDGWKRALAAVQASLLCRGLKPGRDGGDPWRADLDFVCQAKSFTRLVEGYYGAGAPPPRQAVPATDEDPNDIWRRRIRAFHRNAYWNRLDWGPEPGKPGCAVSPEIQREFGVEPAKPQPVGRVA